MYPTNLTDSAWQFIKNFLENKERKRKHSLRDIFNAIIYILKTGCQWRLLPRDFPPHDTVYYYFRKWKGEGVFEEAMNMLVEKTRKEFGRNFEPSLGIIDSRSVKTSHHIDSERGIDGGKKIKGRKCHIVTDTLGLPLAVYISAANIHDSVAAEDVFKLMRGRFPRLKKILADGGYRGERLKKAVADFLGIELEVVLRPDECPSKFEVLPKRWIVERSFSWLENYRRLTIDYEFFAETAEAMVHLAFIAIMLNKIF